MRDHIYKLLYLKYKAGRGERIRTCVPNAENHHRLQSILIDIKNSLIGINYLTP